MTVMPISGYIMLQGRKTKKKICIIYKLYIYIYKLYIETTTFRATYIYIYICSKFVAHDNDFPAF